MLELDIMNEISVSVICTEIRLVLDGPISDIKEDIVFLFFLFLRKDIKEDI